MIKKIGYVLLGISLMVLAYLGRVHLVSENLVIIWLSAAGALVVGWRARNIKDYTAAFGLVFLGTAAAVPISYLFMTVKTGNVQATDFYIDGLEVSALLGFLLLTPWLIIGPASHFTRKLWLRIRA
jgi:hypothetical protein